MSTDLRSLVAVVVTACFVFSSSFASVTSGVNQSFESDVNKASAACLQNQPGCTHKVISGHRPGAKVAGSARTSCHSHGLALDVVLQCNGQRENPQSEKTWQYGQCMSKQVYTCLASASRSQKIGGCSAATHKDHLHFGGCGGEKGPSQTGNYTPVPSNQYASAINDAGAAMSSSGADYTSPSSSFSWMPLMQSWGVLLLMKMMLEDMNTNQPQPPARSTQ